MDIPSKYEHFGEKPLSPESPRGGLDLDLMYVSPVYFGMGRHFNLTPTEALLLATVHSLSENERGMCYMSQQNLANAINVTLSTVNPLLEKLRQDELLYKGGVHPTWRTYQWKLAPKALDYLRYIQERIAKIKASRRKRVQETPNNN